MAQKINPISLRLQNTSRFFDSCWYSKYFCTLLYLRDYQSSQYLSGILEQLHFGSFRLFPSYTSKTTQISLFFYAAARLKRRRRKSSRSFLSTRTPSTNRISPLVKKAPSYYFGRKNTFQNLDSKYESTPTLEKYSNLNRPLTSSNQQKVNLKEKLLRLLTKTKKTTSQSLKKLIDSFEISHGLQRIAPPHLTTSKVHSPLKEVHLDSSNLNLRGTSSLQNKGAELQRTELKNILFSNPSERSPLAKPQLAKDMYKMKKGDEVKYGFSLEQSSHKLITKEKKQGAELRNQKGFLALAIIKSLLLQVYWQNQKKESDNLHHLLNISFSASRKAESNLYLKNKDFEKKISLKNEYLTNSHPLKISGGTSLLQRGESFQERSSEQKNFNIIPSSLQFFHMWSKKTHKFLFPRKFDSVKGQITMKNVEHSPWKKGGYSPMKKGGYSPLKKGGYSPLNNGGAVIQETSFKNPLQNIKDVISTNFNSYTQIDLLRFTHVFQSAAFLATEIVYFLEKRRSSFRQIKYLVRKAVKRFKFVKGFRLICAGRVRSKSKKSQRSRKSFLKYRESSLSVFSERIDFAVRHASTPLGIIGVKVWIEYY